MDILQMIEARRSVRKYTPEPVSDEDLHDLLAAAMAAPSARNERPWHFIVAKEQAMREKLANTSPYTGMAAGAPVVVVIAADMNLQKAPGMWVQDCAAATQNLLLAATGKNLGAVWCGVHPEAGREEHIRKTLDLPSNVIPFCLICLGHPEKTPEPADRYDQDRVHMEKW